MTQIVRTLMARLIDYAGLFPPARLPMDRAVETYARELRGEHAWMLGRFVCPASRLVELSRAAAALMPGTHATSGYREMADATEPWRVAVVIDADLRECIETIALFNRHHAEEENGLAIADVVEVRARDAAFIDGALEEIPEGLHPFFEVCAEGDCRGAIAALAGQPASAKIRTGGLKPELIPAPERVATFIHACAAADVPFKATAGLHHALRGEHALCDGPDAPRAVMHGFLNLFLAAALARASRLEPARTVALLEERSAGAMEFAEDSVSWGGVSIDGAGLARVRESFALSYGSCSLDEPIADLRALRLL